MLKIAISEFKEKAKFLLDKIKVNKERTFSVPEIEAFMQSINCLSLKASSTAKTDITIVVHDQRTSQQPTLGFSIKSQLGSPSTLLNAGKTTNFVFKLTSLIDKTEIERINSMMVKRGTKESADLKGRVKAIYSNKSELNFFKPERQIFSNNLILIDSKLPEILSQIVYEFYSSDKSSVSDLVENTNTKNPLGFDIANDHKSKLYLIFPLLIQLAGIW